MASMTGLSEQQLQQLLGVTDTAQDPSTLGLMPMPSYSASEYGGLFGSSALLMRAAGGPPQGTKNARGSIPAADNSLTEPWPGAYDETRYQNNSRQDVVRNIPAPRFEPQTAAVDAANPLDNKYLGLTRRPTPTPAERAIAEVIVRGGGIQPSGGSNRGRPTRGAAPIMVAAPPRLATADPWASPSGGDLRIGPSTQRPGYATGTPIMRSASAPEPEPETIMRSRPITYDQPRVTVPGTAGSVNGVDMAFMPISVQTSSRWRTGY